MACTLVTDGPAKWECSRDENSHRDYKVTYRVRCGSSLDGPAQALMTPGLPIPGNYYVIDHDIDLWAWCRWNAEVRPAVTNEPNKFFDVEVTFSSKPPESQGGICRNFGYEDPLLEPQRISGTFVKFTEEATYDRFGRAIMTSSFEQIRGPQVEFDRNRPSIRIEQNVANLNLPLLCQMVDTVNDAPLWGLGRRMIKLSNVSWERKFYGACYCYYTRSLEFDVSYETFDRALLDEGNKVLKGRWNTSRTAQQPNEWLIETIDGNPANPRNPTHFIRYKDRHFENSRVILNGAGLPAGVSIQPTESFIITGCCPDKRLPTRLLAVTQNIDDNGLYCTNTGNSGAPMFPPVITLTYNTTRGAWISSDFTVCNNFVFKYEVECNASASGGTADNFSLTIFQRDFRPGANSDYFPLTVINLDSAQCDPFRVVYECNLSIPTTGGRVILGTIQVTIAEATPITQPGIILVQKYNESNFLLLGIPLDFSCRST